MKKIYLTYIIFCFVSTTLWAQTPGELTVSVATSETGGKYAPRNIVAIWIEDDDGNFVKTLLAYANTRKTHLNTWQASTSAAGSEFNVVDAITGATKSSQGTRLCSWDGTDVDGELVQDGVYHVWMELTDKNSTGNYSSFSFTKSNIAENLTPNNVPSFGSISIDWEPDETTVISETGITDNVIIYPNPGTGRYTIEGKNIQEIEIRTIDGKLISKTENTSIDISNQPNGVYVVVIKTDNEKIVERLIKN